MERDLVNRAPEEDEGLAGGDEAGIGRKVQEVAVLLDDAATEGVVRVHVDSGVVGIRQEGAVHFLAEIFGGGIGKGERKDLTGLGSSRFHEGDSAIDERS